MTVKRRGRETKLTIAAPRDGAYRVSILGEDPSKSVNTLFTGRLLASPISLEPGRYTMLVEDISLGLQSRMSLNIQGEPQRIVTLQKAEFRPANRKIAKPSRPSRREAASETTDSNSRSLNAAAPAAYLTQRRMTLGLSLDTQPDRRGGWHPGMLDAHLPDGDEDVIFAISFEQPQFWLEKPKWRLTIAVENDVAVHVPLPLFRGGVRVELTAVETPLGPDVAVTMRPCEPKTAALVGALKRNVSADPTELVEWSAGSNLQSEIAFLSEKMADPWAAVAAALLLVRSGEIGPVAQWAANLAARFPWLADGGVVAAWAHAATSEEEPGEVENVCLRRVVKARRQGALYYSASHALAIEMLTTLASGGTGPNIRSRAQKELDNWSRWTRRLVKGSTFVAWEESADRLTAGTLPEKRYTILASGMVSLGGFAAGEEAQRQLAGSTGSLLSTPDFSQLTNFAPEVGQILAEPTFKLSLDEDLQWALSEEGSGRLLDVFHSKTDALAGGALRDALGAVGGKVEIYSNDGHFQEERSYPGASTADER